jgi:hypothetical protein
MAINKYRDSIGTPDQSPTGVLERTVSDRIVENYPKGAPVLALMSKGFTGKSGRVQQDGLIGKVSTKSMKHEWLAFTPAALTTTVASKTSDTQFILTSIDGVVVNGTIVNLATMEVAFVDTINTSTKEITVDDISGSWGVTAADNVLFCGTAYKESSQNHNMYAQNEDHYYNNIQMFDNPVEMSWSAKSGAWHGKEGYWDRTKRREFIRAKRLIEHSVIFGERASSGLSTTTTSNGDVPTMRGIWRYASQSMSFGGSYTREKVIKDLPIALGQAADDDDEYTWLMGRNAFAETQVDIDQYLEIENAPGGAKKGDRFGMKFYKLVTGGVTLSLVKHYAFDVADNRNRGLVFKNSNISIVQQEGNHMQIKETVQANDKHSRRDMLYGYVSVEVADGGQNVLKLTDKGVV